MAGLVASFDVDVDGVIMMKQQQSWKWGQVTEMSDPVTITFDLHRVHVDVWPPYPIWQIGLFLVPVFLFIYFRRKQMRSASQRYRHQSVSGSKENRGHPEIRARVKNKKDGIKVCHVFSLERRNPTNLKCHRGRMKITLFFLVKYKTILLPATSWSHVNSILIEEPTKQQGHLIIFLCLFLLLLLPYCALKRQKNNNNKRLVYWRKTRYFHSFRFRFLNFFSNRNSGNDRGGAAQFEYDGILLHLLYYY